MRRLYSISLSLAQDISVFLQRAAVEFIFLPKIRGEEAVGVADGREGGLERVFERFGRARGGGVDVRHARELEETFDGGGGDETGAARGGDELME